MTEKQRSNSSRLDLRILCTNFFHCISKLEICQTLVIGTITAIPARYPEIAYKVFRHLIRSMKKVEDGPVHLRVLIGLAEALRSTSRIQDCTCFAIQHVLRDVLPHCDITILDQYRNYPRVNQTGFLEGTFCRRTAIIAIFRSLLSFYDVKSGPDGLSVVERSRTTSENVVQCTGDELHIVTASELTVSNGQCPKHLLDLLERLIKIRTPQQLNLHGVIWDIVKDRGSNMCLWAYFILNFINASSPNLFMDEQRWTGVCVLLVKVTKLHLHSQYMYMPVLPWL